MVPFSRYMTAKMSWRVCQPTLNTIHFVQSVRIYSMEYVMQSTNPHKCTMEMEMAWLKQEN